MKDQQVSTAGPIATALNSMISAGQLAGAATLVWSKNKATQSTCAGWRDIDARLPVERDTIFRIASVTKPITTTVALMLHEEGRFALDEPISRWAPEFASTRVLRSPEGSLEKDATDPAERVITFDDLLTHRSGLTYSDFHRGPIAAAYVQALGGCIDSAVSPDDWIARLAALPLIDQPGRAFHYGYSTDLLGLLIARMERAPLAEVFNRRLFAPLGMKDTGFTVPAEKRHRRAGPYGFADNGSLIKLQQVPGGHALPERPDGMQFASGGQGLWSTVDDFLAFARLFVEGGTVDGVTLLRPATLALMKSNHLTAEQRADSTMFGRKIFAAGHSYGMGVAVVMEPEKADPLRCGGGIGSVGWPGAYGSWWQADPNNKSVLIFFAHNMAELGQLAKGIGLGVWEAISRFQSLASATLNFSAS